MQQNEPCKTSIVSICAPSDIQWLERWEVHLHPLEQAGILSVWSVRHLQAGVDRFTLLHEHLDQADIIVLLLSADFFVDDECCSLMERALVEHQQGTALVLPLRLSPFAFRETKLATFMPLPFNGYPITQWHDQEAAFDDCVRELRRILGRSVTTLLPEKPKLISIEEQKRSHMLRRLHHSYEDLMGQSLRRAASSLVHPLRKMQSPFLLFAVSAIVALAVLSTFILHEGPQRTTPTNVTYPYPSYLPGHGSFSFFDPLSRSDGHWHSQTYIAGQCQFIGGAYHAIPSEHLTVHCPGPFSSNFAFQVQMTIIQGNCGGITFWWSSEAIHTFHQFDVCLGDDKNYYLFNVTNDVYNPNPVEKGEDSSFISGWNDPILLAVVAQGNRIRIFAHQQPIPIIDFQDNSYAQGNLALTGRDNNARTDVSYKNAIVWTL